MRQPKYNPAFLEPTERVRRFGGREHDLHELIQILRENAQRSHNQHVLVVGTRGMGKTTLLLRAVDEVGSEPSLSGIWYPVVAAEETYLATSIGEFWLEMVLNLHHATGDPRHEQAYEALRTAHAKHDDRMLALAALGHLLDFADRSNRRVLLVVENLQMLLGEQLSSRDAWALRETLIGESRLMLLGSAVSSFEAIESPNAPLFEQFLIHRLEPLDLKGCTDVWQRLTGEAIPPRRMRPIQILTGGNPRLLVILTEFAAKLSLGELMRDLASLIDDHTDYLKMTTEALPKLERKVFVALAEIWEYATAAQVASRARVELNTASAQLNRLVQRGAVAWRHRGRGKQYRVAERLYCIYHLMRRRGGIAARARAVTEFMAAYYEGAALLEQVGAIAQEALALSPNERADHLFVLEAFLESPVSGRVREAVLARIPADFRELPDAPQSLKRWLVAEPVGDARAKETPASLPQAVREAMAAVERVEGPWASRVQALEHLVAVCRDAAEARMEAVEPVLGKALNDLGGVLRDLGRRQEALDSTREAVQQYRHLVQRGSAAGLPGLATSLNNLGVVLTDLRQREEALDVTRAAVEIARKLADADPETFVPGLVGGLNNLGIALSDLGQHEGALEATAEAVRLARKLTEVDPERFLPDLAGGLNNLGNRLGDLGRREEAFDASREAVEIRRKLAGGHPETVRGDLADSLSNLGHRLRDLGRSGEALEVTREAVAIQRTQGDDLPGSLHRLGGSLNNLGVILSDLRRHGEALEVTREAVALHRWLAQAHPEAFLPRLAGCLSNLGNRLVDLGRSEEALDVARETVAVYRELADGHQRIFGASLVDSLSALDRTLWSLGRREEALNAMREAVEISRRLAEADPEGLRPRLAGALTNLGANLNALGRREEALEATREAVEYYGGLAEARVGAFRSHLARSLRNLATLLSGLGQPEAAEDALKRSLGVEPESANARRSLCLLQLGQGRVADAVEGFRVLLASEPGGTPRIQAATDVAIALASAGAGHKALEAIESSSLAPSLEPLVVALKKLEGLDFSAPAEIEEIAEDILKQIREAPGSPPGEARS